MILERNVALSSGHGFFYKKIHNLRRNLVCGWVWERERERKREEQHGGGGGRGEREEEGREEKEADGILVGKVSGGEGLREEDEQQLNKVETKLDTECGESEHILHTMLYTEMTRVRGKTPA